MVMGTCLKDGKKVEIVNPKYELNKKGAPAVRGTCPICKKNMYTMIKATDAPPELRAKMAARKKGGGTNNKKKSSRTSRKSSSSRSSRKSSGSRRK